MRLTVLSSTPPSPLQGSGTFVGIAGLARGLGRRGHTVGLRPLVWRTRFHTFDRLLYNVLVALSPPRADVVVGVDLDGFLWARRRRQPYVVALKGVIADELTNEQGWVRTLLGVQARWERANCHRADIVMVPSQYSASAAAAAYDVPADRIAVVPEALDLAEWRRLFAAAPRGSTLEPTVLAVGRMYPRKRFGDLLHAAALLRTRIPHVRIRIVGDGPEAPRLRALHARLALGANVVFLGEVSRQALAVEYMGAHCFCLPSVQEGFGFVFAEAMAAGLPVIGCRAGAVPELVVDGHTGLLVAPRNPGELAAALERVLLDEGLRKEMGGQGMRRVEAFDLDRVAESFLKALPA